MRTLAFGDIHGCYDSLVALWDEVEPTPKDTIIFLGDYVDRGPHSKQVIDFLLEKMEGLSLIRLTGNHEEKFLLSRVYDFEIEAWIEDWDAIATLDSYGIDNRTNPVASDAIPESHWEFLRTCRPFYETDTHIFIHASIEYDLPLIEQQPYTLIHKKLVIQDQPHISGKTVVCGHTAQKNHLPLDLRHTICIDTDAGRNGWVTCLDVEKGTYWQANQEKVTRRGKL